MVILWLIYRKYCQKIQRCKTFFVKMAVLVYPAHWLPFQWNGSHSWHKCNYMAFLWLVLRQFCQKETDTLVFFIQYSSMRLLDPFPLGQLTWVALVDWRGFLWLIYKKIIQKLSYHTAFHKMIRLGTTVANWSFLQNPINIILYGSI